MIAVLAEAALRSFVLGSVVWIGLQLLRVRNPHLHMTSWLAVLAASLAMPLLMHWATVTIAVPSAPLAAPASLWLPEMSPPVLPEPGIAAAMPAGVAQHVNWWTVATAVYAGVAGILLMRLAVGLVLTWRLVRAAKPLDSLADVRVSDHIGGPVTFGSTILVPPQFMDWDLPKRQAVLAHEGAHVVNRDFYILLLASLNRSLFWFSPFAWWQFSRLAELAEIISDSQAIEVLDDKLSYAEILLELVQKGRPRPLALEMARACTVRARVERILEAAVLAPRIGWRKRAWIAAAIAPVVIVSAGSIAYRSVPASAQALHGAAAPALHKPEAIQYYAMGPASIFAISREGDGVYGQLTGQRKVRLALAQDGNYSYPTTSGPITFTAGEEAQSSALKLRQNGQDVRAGRIAELPRVGVAIDPALLDRYVGWYQLTPTRVLAVTRDGDRMHARETGMPAIEIRPQGPDSFSSAQDDLLIFLRDSQAMVEKVLIHDSMSGARLARKIDADKAMTIEEQFARHVAQAPDRFREQAPAPGSKEAVLRGIADLRAGTPNYDRMSRSLAAKIRRQAAELHDIFVALGAVDSIFFRGVGPGGYDIYGAKFANGAAEFRILLAGDGKAEDVLFRPDGDETPGGIAACSQEADLKPRDGTAPIRMLLYNDSGDDIQIYKLDGKGRTLQGTVGDNMTSNVTTSVGHPLVIADRSGRCIDIVLPGQRTRYHTVDAPHSGDSERPVSPRTTPHASSEAMLRQYIEALVQGRPNYDRMTPEVAIQTRQQLALNQAILTRLGALRALAFRAVTALGSDVYMVHFANGTAEWRIGLTRDGSINRIALGPSS